MSMYRSYFDKETLVSGDIPIRANEYNKIGEYKVPAGIKVLLGYGENESQEAAPGRIYADLRDGAAAPGAALDGILRFEIHTPQGRMLEILDEFPTSALRTDAANRTLQIPFPAKRKYPWISEDKKLVVYFKPTAVGNGTLSKVQSKIQVDMTEQAL
jgi:hypothetical protein